MPGPDVLHLLYGGLGGQHRLVLDLAAGFRRVGLTTGVIAYGPVGQLLSERSDWPDVDTLHVVPKARRLDLAGSRRIRHILRGSGARALLWHSAYAPVAVRAALRRREIRTTVLVEHQSVGLRPVAEDLRSLVGMLVSRRTVVLSEAFRQQHPLRRLRMTSLRNAAVIPNGVDIDGFAPAARRRDAPQVVRCAAVGRLVASRDLATALETIGLLRQGGVDAVLEVVGDGPARQSLEQMVGPLGRPGEAAEAAIAIAPEAPVRFTGRVPAAAVGDHLRAADVYLHPSLGEARSTALLQAWATGLPVVAARVPGIDDLVRDGEDGLLVPPSDPVAMSDAVQRLIEDPELAARLGAAGRRRAVAEFSIGATIRGYLSVLADADPEGPWRDALARTVA